MNFNIAFSSLFPSFFSFFGRLQALQKLSFPPCDGTSRSLHLLIQSLLSSTSLHLLYSQFKLFLISLVNTVLGLFFFFLFNISQLCSSLCLREADRIIDTEDIGWLVH